jgi:nucleoside-diphosphate-sugar epimerase
VVVDWVAYTPEHIETDIELFAGKAGQFIFISSASAYQKPPSDYLITESTPLYNPVWKYSQEKIACEERLDAEYRKNGFPITIVRPSLTYGVTMIPAGVASWQHPWTLVDRIRSGRKIIVHGDGTSLWTITHNTDFAKGFVGLMGHTRAVGHAFHITSDEVLTWNQIYEAIGAAAGRRANIVHIPSDFIALYSADERGNLLGDKAHSGVFDNSKIKRFVPGFVATVPYAAGVKRSVEWFEKHPERQTVDTAYNAMVDQIITAYEGRG